jgi:hypothetical protein
VPEVPEAKVRWLIEEEGLSALRLGEGMNAPATIDVRTIRREGQWRILQLFVNSEALIPGWPTGPSPASRLSDASVEQIPRATPPG